MFNLPPMNHFTLGSSKFHSSTLSHFLFQVNCSACSAQNFSGFSTLFLYSCRYCSNEVILDIVISLNDLSGIWDGPVTSTTGLGSYPEWIVDFRPVSGAQVSAKNELDSVNDILMSFFIVQHAGAFKMAFRNGGGFAGSKRIAYAMID